MISQEKREVGKWWLWILGLLVVSSIIFTSLRYLSIIGNTIMERNVFENSYQKTTADKKAYDVYSAQLAEIESRLSNNLDEQTRQDLEAQRAMLKVQIRALK